MADPKMQLLQEAEKAAAVQNSSEWKPAGELLEALINEYDINAAAGKKKKSRTNQSGGAVAAAAGGGGGGAAAVPVCRQSPRRAPGVVQDGHYFPPSWLNQ